jgi:hypothetical protein
LEWFERNAQAAYDPAATQLFLSVVSIHTTTDLLCQALEDISAHPEIIDPLKDEIREVIKQEGWSTKALYKMKLLDSVLKESQRLKPVQVGKFSTFIPSVRPLTYLEIQFSFDVTVSVRGYHA